MSVLPILPIFWLPLTLHLHPLVYVTQWWLGSYLGVISAVPVSVWNCSRLVKPGTTFTLAVAVALTTAVDRYWKSSGTPASVCTIRRASASWNPFSSLCVNCTPSFVIVKPVVRQITHDFSTCILGNFSTDRYRGILVYNICLINISNSVFDGATKKSVLNIESS